METNFWPANDRRPPGGKYGNVRGKARGPFPARCEENLFSTAAQVKEEGGKPPFEPCGAYLVVRERTRTGLKAGQCPNQRFHGSRW